MTKAEWKARALDAEEEVERLTDELRLAEGRIAEADIAADKDRDEIERLRGQLFSATIDLDLWKQRALDCEGKTPPPPPPPPPTGTKRWFADSSPWNQTVRDKPIHPNSQAIINQILDGLPGVNDQQGQPSRPTANVIAFSAGACWNQWDYEHPVFWAKDTDPLKTITGNSSVTGQKIRVPANAWSSQHPPPSGGGDSIASIVQPDGTGYDFWRATFGPTEVHTEWGEKVDNYLTGDGIGGITLGDFAVGAGVLRPHEFVEGLIPHAVFLVTFNFSGWQPGLSGNQPFRYLNHPNVPKMGTRLRLELTDTEIAALPAHLRPLATACRDYGLITGDTGGGGLHADNSDKAAWDAAGKASGAPVSGGTYTWDLRPYVDMRSKLKVLA